MSKFRVRVLARALNEFIIADAWWRTHRLASPEALTREFKAARELLTDFPELGRIDEDQGGEIRRIRLPVVRYVVYYRVNKTDRIVDILALWHASRQPPELQ